jgi:type III pantothenate kinase
MGVYDGKELIKDWRIRTERNTTEDEFNILITGLFEQSGMRLTDVDRTIISSVVPPMVTILDSFCRKYLGYAPHWVNASSYSRMPILFKNPAEVGADRIVNAVAAYHKYKTSLIAGLKSLSLPSVLSAKTPPAVSSPELYTVMQVWWMEW